MKSPLKSKPLRNPGESVDRELQNVIYDDVFPCFLAAMFLVPLAILEWFRWYTSTPPSPTTYTVLALIAVGFGVWKFQRVKVRIRNLKLGREGEKSVGQDLERLREVGAKIFHDIPAPGFNVDHVVVHETGMYAIETKTLSKPDQGETKLVYDGEKVLRNGLAMDRNPIQQVRAARDWLVDVMKESTGKTIPAQAVVLYPGWYIERTAEAKLSDVWVLNPKAFPAFVAVTAPRLRMEDINLCAYHLGQYIRAVNES